MTAPNGNMTTDERRALQPGAVVSYRSERMLSEIQGTVDAVRCSGRLALCDGAFVFSCDYCRLVSAMFMVSTQPNVRGLDGDGVAQASGGPRDAQKTPGGSPQPSADKPGGDGLEGLRALERQHHCFAGVDGNARVAELRGEKPAQDRQQTARVCEDCGGAIEDGRTAHYCPRCRRERQSKCPGGKRADRELWALAVRDVDKARARGMTTAQAVAVVHKDAGFASLKLTVGTYRWWRREFAREAPQQAPATSLAEQLETMRRQFCAARQRAAELSADLNAAMEALASVRTELAQRPVTLAGRTDDDMRLMELVLGGQPRT